MLFPNTPDSPMGIRNFAAETGFGSSSRASFPDRTLDVGFYNRTAGLVARELLGQKISVQVNGQRVAGLITDVQAYPGKNDKDTTAYIGASSDSIPWQPGSVYVYSRQEHNMVAVAAPLCDEGACVLIRAIKVIEGLQYVAARGVACVDGYVSDPENVSKALAITVTDNGKHLHANSMESEGIKMFKGVDVREDQVVNEERPDSKGSPELKLRWRIIGQV